MKPRLIIDNHIPYIKGVFDEVADVDYLAANEMTHDVVKNADALIIRTRTICNKDLLEGSKIKIIATATIGIDHIDTEYCDKKGIIWKNAPGCNAKSVAQWIGSALALWACVNHFSLKKKILGIVGHGHVGKEVENMARMLGMDILLNDPFLESKNETKYTDLNDIAQNCDVISFHTPLTTVGEHKTFHLADNVFFNNLLKSPYIINSARGGVIDEAELAMALKNGKVGDCAIDCWENEPNTNSYIRNRAIVSTSHIAGYSADGKFNASQQTIKTISDFFNIKPKETLSLSEQEVIYATQDELPNILLNKYDIRNDSNVLKNNPDLFEYYRGNYPLRREIKLRINI